TLDPYATGNSGSSRSRDPSWFCGGFRSDTSQQSPKRWSDLRISRNVGRHVMPSHSEPRFRPQMDRPKTLRVWMRSFANGPSNPVGHERRLTDSGYYDF